MVMIILAGILFYIVMYFYRGSGAVIAAATISFCLGWIIAEHMKERKQ